MCLESILAQPILSLVENTGIVYLAQQVLGIQNAKVVLLWLSWVSSMIQCIAVVQFGMGPDLFEVQVPLSYNLGEGVRVGVLT